MIIGIVIFAVGLSMTLFGNSTNDKEPKISVKNKIETVANNVNPDRERPDSSLNDPKKKGNDFEDYVANILKSNSIRIKEWNKGTVTDEGAFGENALNPDMFVSDKEGKVDLEYWIECKFRSELGREGFLLEEKQVNRYWSIQGASQRKILIALGLGGQAKEPKEFFLIPLDSLKRFKHIPEKYLSHYSVENPRENLKSHVRNYFFQDVFKKKDNDVPN